ncbi:MAG: hypothetical protein KGJ80_07390 [Chloroflexota bacterium]|nr:hypothetical protein [Chloroflexota bacterium]
MEDHKAHAPSAEGSEDYLAELRERARHARALAQEAEARASAADGVTEREMWERTVREYLDEAQRVEELIDALDGKTHAADGERS